MIREHPLVGLGPGNWPVAFPRYAEPGATRDGVLSVTLAPRQAHDDLLERAAETGLPGLFALGALATGAAIAVRRRLQSGDEDGRSATAAAAGALAALAALALASFPLEMPGPLTLGGLALGLVAADGQAGPSRPTPRPLSYAPVAGAIALLVWAAVRAESAVRASRWLGTAERAMRRDPGPVGADEALAALEHALAASPNDYRAQLRTAQMLRRVHRARESAQAARLALALEPYAPNARAALAAAELDVGDNAAARRDADRALAILHDYPHALYTRALAAAREGDLSAAEADRRALSELAAGADSDMARAARALLEP
jgi:tetratricopeptide (TPR) repeat protein